ncbi:PilZ domain-containing protein [Pseudodesulfovibrio sp.]|uniref:PilZ domain-containing protein n=1 Tax=Pseudodesulfovibrio sp. TaxID=2035812 RepID=UPI002619FBF2|nr:PilZ domain-containing protein [Pseudodesulfovibrio sp.]MDD3310767.1 PilZ domain-containing protein [Pseudodesulfovibrio sp.]
MTPSAESRQFKRIGIESVVLPFLGARVADFQPFQYLLRDMSQGGVGVTLPRWLASRERLNLGDEVNLHVPFSMDGGILAIGEVVRESWDEDNEEQVVGIRLTRNSPNVYGVFFEADSRDISFDLGRNGLEGLLTRVIKDSVLLKRGILIYLRHLASYFSRLSEYTHEEYQSFRETIIDDVRGRIRTHADYLETVHRTCCDTSRSSFERIDLEELRQAMEPELYLDLFRAALGDDTASLFLHAIKELEGKLFSNYNTVVMLYIGTF